MVNRALQRTSCPEAEVCESLMGAEAACIGFTCLTRGLIENSNDYMVFILLMLSLMKMMELVKAKMWVG